jgi:uncharacterized protein YndB with AHSA1/START domain
MKITIETTVNAPLPLVWSAWTTPDDITQWNTASPEWCCPKAVLDLRPEGRFSYRMEARDGSMGFDFEGTFTIIKQHELIEFSLEDNRNVQVAFSETPDGILLQETFEAEDEHAAEQQRQGWQAILDNFKKHTENKADSG